MLGNVELDAHAFEPEREPELVERRRERTLGLGARHREHRPGRGRERETLIRREPCRAPERFEPVGDDPIVVDDQLEQRVRCVRGESAACGKLELADKGSHLEAEARREVAEGGLADAGEVREDGEESAKPRAGVDGVGRPLNRHGGSPPRTAASRRRMTSRRISVGASTSTASPSPSTHR